MAVLGFIGAGNMGYAMLKGASNVMKKDDLIYTDVNVQRLEEVKADTGISYVTSNIELAKNVKYIVLAVKPQFLDGVLEE